MRIDNTATSSTPTTPPPSPTPAVALTVKAWRQDCRATYAESVVHYTLPNRVSLYLVLSFEQHSGRSRPTRHDTEYIFLISRPNSVFWMWFFKLNLISTVFECVVSHCYNATNMLKTYSIFNIRRPVERSRISNGKILSVFSRFFNTLDRIACFFGLWYFLYCNVLKVVNKFD